MQRISFSELVREKKFKDRRFDITIGVFDGMHLGHRKIINSLIDFSRKDDCASLVITFDRNPKNIHLPFMDTERIRNEKFSSLGIDFLAVIDFSPDFATMSALEFASLLSSSIRVSRLVVGRDFRCGAPQSQLDGTGLAESLSDGKEEVKVSYVDYALLQTGERISSTLVRKKLKEGNVEAYALLSGQSYMVDMKVLPSSYHSGVLFLDLSTLPQLLPLAGTYEASLNDGKKDYPGLLFLDRTFGKFYFSLEAEGRSDYYISLVIRRRI